MADRALSSGMCRFSSPHSARPSISRITAGSDGFIANVEIIASMGGFHPARGTDFYTPRFVYRGGRPTQSSGVRTYLAAGFQRLDPIDSAVANITGG